MVLLAAAAVVGCGEKAPEPTDRSSRVPSAVAQPGDLVEGPVVVYGLRLPLGAGKGTVSAAQRFTIPAHIDAVDRYLRARLSTKAITRRGRDFIYEGAKPVGTENDGTLALEIVLSPAFGGSTVSIQREAVGVAIAPEAAASSEAETGEAQMLTRMQELSKRQKQLSREDPPEVFEAKLREMKPEDLSRSVPP
jgi:hypothetical protein